MAEKSRIHVPLLQPEDVIPHLGKGALHWKEGRSARLLAEQWFTANSIPDSVASLLDDTEEWRGAALVDAFLERVTDLPWGSGAGTQTDLLATVRLKTDELAVLGIEAKVDETLGPLCSEWLAAGKSNREERLRGLCRFLGVPFSEASPFRYQLFHRIAGALLEAERYGAKTAALLVQSWCPKRTGFKDFCAFSEWAGFGLVAPGRLSPTKRVGSVKLRLGWVAE